MSAQRAALDVDPVSGHRRQYVTLDGLRGAAAILVLLCHFGLDTVQYVPRGDLAVNFFFVLSGFVLAKAYDARLRGGLPLGSFAMARFLRFYPLYLLGMLFGAAFQLVLIVYHSPRALGAETYAATFAAGLLMLPPPVPAHFLYPFNVPAWSLLFELLINFLFAAVLWRLRSRGLAIVVLVSGIALVAMMEPPNYMNIGSRHVWSEFAGGLLRTLQTFPLGMLIARWHGRRTGGSSWLALLPMLMLVVAMTYVVPAGLEGTTDVVVGLVLPPLILLAGAAWEPPAGLRRLFAWLGEISFPLYAVHLPLIQFFHLGARHIRLPLPIQSVLVLSICLLVAAPAARWFDEPIRRWFAGRRPRPGHRSARGAGNVISRTPANVPPT